MQNIRLLSKFHSSVKMVLFAIFFAKFFNHMYAYAFKIYQKICRKIPHFSRRSQIRKKSILIVKTSALGDVIHTFPVAAYLRSRFSQAKIDWVVERGCRSLVENHPCIDEALIIDTRGWRKGPFSSSVRHQIKTFFKTLRSRHYDIVFDLQGNIKSGLVTAAAKSSLKVGFAWDSVPEWPNTLFTNKRFSISKGQPIQEDYLQLVQSYFDDHESFSAPAYLLNLNSQEEKRLKAIQEHLQSKSKHWVMVCHGSNWKNKKLPSAILIDFLKRLQQQIDCYFLFAWGTSIEEQEAKELEQQFLEAECLEKVSLPLLQHLMDQMQLVVAMDSLPLHLAATTNVPTFSVFGASLAAKYAPYGSQHLHIQGSCPYDNTFSKRCPLLRSCSTGACMQTYSGEQLFDLWQSSCQF